MTSLKSEERFYFKEFALDQDQCTMKIGTDGVLLGAWADVQGAQQILDIGTGTGLIGIMLGQRTKDSQAKIVAVEIEDQAFQQAIENAEKAPWGERVEVVFSAVQDFAKEHQTQEKYDLIVSNPPFFSGGTFSKNQERNSVRHTVKLPHGDLLSAVRSLLAPNGKFSVVLPLIEGMRFQELALDYNLFCTRITKVRPKINKSVARLLLQFEKQEKEAEISELVIQKEGRNNWTAEYIRLTKAFYLNM